MIEGATKLKFHFNTYHLAVQYVDSFLLTFDNLPDYTICQVIAATSLMLAGTVDINKNV